MSNNNTSDETQMQNASDLKPAAEIKEEQAAEVKGQYSVPIEGKVYAVEADNSTEAAEKANKLHKKGKK